MLKLSRCVGWLPVLAVLLCAWDAQAQSFRVQCPASTALHPLVTPTADNPTGANPHIKCQQISGGDGFATMADGTQTYLFAFGPLSGLADIAKGLPGTQSAGVFNQNNVDGSGNVLDVIRIAAPSDPAHPDAVDPGFAFNGAVGLVPDPESVPPNQINGHVDPRLIMDVGVLNGNIPAPLIAIDEGDELFLTLTNVGQIMRPDLFEQHTAHFHGYANASSFYDGVPDASIAINIGGSFTYYYLAPEAGTYMWHCHISPPEHLQMGMVGQIYVRPKQNGAAETANTSPASLKTQLIAANKASATSGGGVSCNDILCAGQTPAPAAASGSSSIPKGTKFAYNDGDGSTAYDVEYPIQLHGFDPNFHFVGMTFNPESFVDNKDKFFLLNGRSYPDTIQSGPMSTQASDGIPRFSQPLSSLITIPSGKKALLRLSDLNVTEFHTLVSLGIPMHVVGMNARLLRDLDGNNMDYVTNSITLGGGESIDVILDATGIPAGSVFYLYTSQLDHLSNDAENFGGMMTEIRIN